MESYLENVNSVLRDILSSKKQENDLILVRIEGTVVLWNRSKCIDRYVGPDIDAFPLNTNHTYL